MKNFSSCLLAELRLEFSKVGLGYVYKFEQEREGRGDSS
jgi:hypothetical protein